MAGELLRMCDCLRDELSAVAACFGHKEAIFLFWFRPPVDSVPLGLVIEAVSATARSKSPPNPFY